MRKLMLMLGILSPCISFAGTHIQQNDTNITVGSMTLTTGGGGIRFADGSTQISAGGGGGLSSLGINYNGVPITTPTAQVNFIGSGVSVSASGSTATVTISGGGGVGSSTTTVHVNNVVLSPATTNFNFVQGSGLIITASTPTVNTVNLTFNPDTAILATRSTASQGLDNTCNMTSGSNTTYVGVASGNAILSYADGMRVLAKIDTTSSGGAITLDCGAGAKKAFQYDGTSNPTAAQWGSGQQVLLAYGSALNSGAGGWRLLSGSSSAGGGSSTLAVFGSSGTNTTSVVQISSSTPALLLDTTNFILTPNIAGTTTQILLNPNITVSTITTRGSGNLSFSNGAGVLSYQLVGSSAGVTVGDFAKFSSSWSIVDGGSSGGGGGTPGGSSGQLQYNNSSAFGGVPKSVVTTSSVTFGPVLVSTLTVYSTTPTQQALVVMSTNNAVGFSVSNSTITAGDFLLTISSVPGGGGQPLMNVDTYGTLGILNIPLATLKTTTPNAINRFVNCSDCATTSLCVSTGTTAAYQYSSAVAKGSQCL